MTRLFSLFFALLITATPAALADATFYLVRHAEKAADGTRDPDLTAEGRARAQWIARYLEDKGLTGVYSTDYKRTRQTAQPAADKMGLAVDLYDPRALEAFAVDLKGKTGVFLVVGHSNTTPVLTNLLAGSNLKYAGEDVYDQIFEVKISDAGTARVSVSFSKPRQDHVTKLEALKEAMANRLGVMAQVARYKWNNNLPVEAPEREAAVLEASIKRATELGLDPNYASRVVTAQMDASKTLQRSLFKEWQATGAKAFDNVPSLADDIRPKIDLLTEDLLKAAQKAEFMLTFCSSRAALDIAPSDAGIASNVWRAAARGLTPLEPCVKTQSGD